MSFKTGLKTVHQHAFKAALSKVAAAAGKAGAAGLVFRPESRSGA
jgi:hypothetical protein